MNVTDKIKKARNNIVCDYGFFARLLLSCTISENNDMCPTMCTDGNNIYYNSEFIDKLSLGETAFIMLHEVMHCALGHLWRRDDRYPYIWNLATDFAVNGLIVSIGDNYYHKNIQNMSADLALKLERPNGTLFESTFLDKSAEEIYNILLKNSDMDSGNGQIVIKGNDGSSNSNNNSSDGNNKQNQKSSQGKSKNSKKQSKEGWWLEQNKDGSYSGNLKQPNNHGTWIKADKASAQDKQQQINDWEDKLIVSENDLKQAGIGSFVMERLIGKIKNPQKNWKNLLQDFIQEEVNDYSWTPPDKRYDGDFFLCDYNDTVETVKDILFFVDTSGSMSEKQLNMCYSEIQGAINQFNNHLKGTLLFFDYEVQDTKYNFDDVNGDISELASFGGGGTSYDCIFEYLKLHETEFDDINGVIILTDGYCDYPEQEPPYPILWVYTNHDDNNPPFGLATELDEVE